MISDPIKIALISIIPTTLTVIITSWLQFRQSKRVEIKQDARLSTIYDKVDGSMSTALEKINKLEAIIQDQQIEINEGKIVRKIDEKERKR